MDPFDKSHDLAPRLAAAIDKDKAKRAAAEHIRQVSPLDCSMGWRLDEVLAAFTAGAAWRPAR